MEPERCVEEIGEEYWKYLYSNMQRVIFEIYRQCEKQENNSHCEEMVEVLNNLRGDFRSLKSWIEIKNFQPSAQKPPFVSWCLSGNTQQQELSGKQQPGGHDQGPNCSSGLPLIREVPENDSTAFCPYHSFGKGFPTHFQPTQHIYVPQEYGDVYIAPGYEHLSGNFAETPIRLNSYETMYNMSELSNQITHYENPASRSGHHDTNYSQGRSNAKSRRTKPCRIKANESYITKIDQIEGVYNKYCLSLNAKPDIEETESGMAENVQLSLGSKEATSIVKNTCEPPVEPLVEDFLPSFSGNVQPPVDSKARIDSLAQQSQSQPVLRDILNDVSTPFADSHLDVPFKVKAQEHENTLLSQIFKGKPIHPEGRFSRDRGAKRTKPSSNFSWARFDVVLSSDKVEKTEKKAFNIESGNSDVEFPRLVPNIKPSSSMKTSDGAISNDSKGQKQNFAAALLSNTKTKQKGQHSEELGKGTPLLQKRSYKEDSGKKRTDSLTLDKETITQSVKSPSPKHVDQDGWQTVKMKSKRDDGHRISDKVTEQNAKLPPKPRRVSVKSEQKEECESDSVDKKKGEEQAKCSGPSTQCAVISVAGQSETELKQNTDCGHDHILVDNEVERLESDLEEQVLSEEETRKCRELKQEELMLTRKIKDLESSEPNIADLIESEIEADDHIMDPTEIHKLYTEYFQSISLTDQIDEMEKFADILSNEAGEFKSATLETFEVLVTQYPGRALELRRRMANRYVRKDQEEKNLTRRKKAEEKRQQLLTEKTTKMRELVQKVEEVKAQQFILAQERKYRLDLKLKRAEENRNQHLSIIRRKAHDEEEKLKEIAFINELEAQNRRHESMALRQEQEERLQNILEERQRKVGEKAAKEAAVEERRRVIEAERQEKLEKMQEKRRKKEEIIGRKQREKENKRLVIAREKAREREERLQARHAAQLANVEELQKKIQQKQESSARRHEENIELIRQKAFETGSLRTAISDDDAYQTNICKHPLQDEAKNKGEAEESESHVVDAEKVKASKKRTRKLKSRLLIRGKEICNNNNHLHLPSGSTSKLASPIKEILSLIDRDNFDLNEENAVCISENISQINSLLFTNTCEREWFRRYNGFEAMVKITTLINSVVQKKQITTLLTKCFCKSFLLIRNCCCKSVDNLMHMCTCGGLLPLMDTLRYRLIDLIEGSKFSKDCGIILNSMACILIQLKDIELDKKSESILKDIISYIVCSGLMSKFIGIIRFATENEKPDIDGIITSLLEFLTAITAIPVQNKELIDCLSSSDFLGTVSLLYEGCLQKTKGLDIPKYTEQSLKFLLSIAYRDIQLFQNVLGAEGMYLQLRHIANYLLTVCAQDKTNKELLHVAIELIGFFAVMNKDNQLLLQSGQTPTVLQQLIYLPFPYFCEPDLIKILFPTLIACSYDNPTNKTIIENELNYKELEKFLQIEENYTIKLIQMFKKLSQ